MLVVVTNIKTTYLCTLPATANHITLLSIKRQSQKGNMCAVFFGFSVLVKIWFCTTVKCFMANIWLQGTDTHTDSDLKLSC